MVKRKSFNFSDYVSNKKLKQYVAGAAGGALGMIVDNVPGAIAGAEMAYNFVGDGTDGLPEKNKMGAVRKAIKNETTVSTRGAVCRVKGKKLKQGKGKKIKVSTALRQKIGKVIEEKKIHGRWLQKSFAYIPLDVDGKQFVGYPNYNALKTDFSQEWNFLPEDLLHIASVLFNGKADGQGTARELYTQGTLGISDGVDGAGQPTNTGTCGCNAKFHVKKSWVEYLLRNNTHSSLKVLAYTCAIRAPQSYRSTSNRKPDGTNETAQKTGVLAPTQFWVDCLATQTGYNPTGATTTLLGMRPEKHPLWTKTYKHEVCEMIIEPGQSIKFTVQGPSEMDLDYQKFWSNNQFMSIQKFSRSVFFIVENELVQGKNTQYDLVGRWKAGTDSAGASDTKTICIEKTMGMSISVPESTGMKVGPGFIANATMENNMKRNVFGHVVYLTDRPSNITKVDEENPVAAISSS